MLFDFQIVTCNISLQTSTLSFFSINASVKLYPKSVVRGNECIWISNHVKLICSVQISVKYWERELWKANKRLHYRSSKKLITTTFKRIDRNDRVLLRRIKFAAWYNTPWIISLIGADVTPFAYLEIGRAMIEQFQHMPDVLCVLNHEVQFHVEFAAHQLQSETMKIDIRLCKKLCIRKLESHSRCSYFWFL